MKPAETLQAPGGRNLEEAIALFEGILQTTPDDQVALEVLSLAYEQQGNLPLAHATLIRLAKVLIAKGDTEAAPGVIARLRPVATDNFDALDALSELEALLQGGAAPAAEKASPPAQPAAAKESPPLPGNVALRRQVMQREMDLAWRLLEAEELTQEEYATLVEDLTSLVTSETDSPLSIQHIMADRTFSGIDRIRQYMVKKGRCPFLALENFELQPPELPDTTLDYLLLLGALPFANIGKELLIGLLNSADSQLQTTINNQLGTKCHYFLITCEAFDAALKQLRGSAA